MSVIARPERPWQSLLIEIASPMLAMTMRKIMNIKYCLPIIKNSKQEVLEHIEKYESEYSFIEVWVDYIKDLDTQFIENLVEKLQGKLIVVFRRQNLEKPHMSFEMRKNILQLLISKPCFVDLDITTQLDELKLVRNNSFQLITSYHNYENTPHTSKVVKIIKEMEQFSPKIYKVATLCNSEKDALQLLYLLLDLKEEGKRCIILGMGNEGVITRIFGTLWGNEMIFAPVTSQDNSAPGQLTRKQLEVVFNELSS